MSQRIEAKLAKIPVIGKIATFLDRVEFKSLGGFSLYDLLELYIIGIAQGAVSYRATAIAFTFFMALFPFALFILNLIPYIPIEGFQSDFLQFVEEAVPPNTFDAIANIINDILLNSHSGLLSTGFILSIFLMSNGLSAILNGFESSRHIIHKRGFFRQYAVAMGMSLVLSFLLLFTIATIVVFEVFLQRTKIQDVLSENISLIILGRYVFVLLMILITVSILFKFGTKREKDKKFISVGSIFTTILIILSSFGFGIWVVRFSQYNELYGSIGTLLIMMFYIWINCLVLLLGFELDASINKLRKNARKVRELSHMQE